MTPTRLRAIAIGVALLVLASGTTSADAVPKRGAASPLTGRWERVNTCQQLVRALTRYGLRPLAPSMLAGNGYVAGTARQIAARRHICRGATPRRHSHFFRADGQFGSVDFNDQQVDDGRYRLVNPHTVRIGSPPQTFHMRIDHGHLRLSPMISPALKRVALAHPLRFSAAGWMVAVAFPGHSWKRVPCAQWC